VKVTAAGPSYPQLGEIDYLFNNAKYHFWFTATADLGRYDAGHTYHNVCKYYDATNGDLKVAAITR
jgi:hypothetical protein